MMITGPYVTRTVHVPAHDVTMLDAGAYWNLGFDGEPLADGEPLTLLYARVAFPTLAAARHQYRTERLALDAQRAHGRHRKGNER